MACSALANSSVGKKMEILPKGSRHLILQETGPQDQIYSGFWDLAPQQRYLGSLGDSLGSVHFQMTVCFC